jgi:hypothetical protein
VGFSIGWDENGITMGNGDLKKKNLGFTGI